ncbi:protein-arginine deiminase type-1-like isoform X2 [Pseudophryne corroboree]|uniref:protein-arginine deiminase type-1-like isoform X2 n=1 Tax=Pseudophryne corroboree TaxID=495146 RepID=UPI003081979F
MVISRDSRAPPRRMSRSLWKGSIPKGADSFDVRGSGSLDVTIIYNPKTLDRPQDGEKWPLNKCIKVVITPQKPSKELNDNKIKVWYYGSQRTDVRGNATLYLTCVGVSLDVDVSRIGAVTRGVKNKDSWSWGPGGKGAVLLVNCDRDRNCSGLPDNQAAEMPNTADLKDMSPMVLTAEGPDEVFNDYKVILSMSEPHSNKLRVYQTCKNTHFHVLGKGKVSYKVHRQRRDEVTFYVEGLDFPDVDFPGLVYINLTFQNVGNGTEIFKERVAFRVAPWIMTPNTQKPLEVYVCNVDNNKDFVKVLAEFVKKARCTLTVCKYTENQGDRWIQDEMEFGYVEAPHKRFPVVLDSPRNRGLKDFPATEVLGPDFGYVTREPKDPDSVGTLDAFGNLEVSPPVTAGGKDYPLGRILIGDGLNMSDFRMNKVVRDFLHAQQVQAPVYLFSTWLQVSHIDEFLSFVPAPDRKGFRLLLASPKACWELFKQKQKEGHGSAAMFEGLKATKYTIDEILADKTMETSADTCQEYIDMNRKIMKQELGLCEKDIIDIPVLYKCHSSTKYAENAEAFFPNMVNMLVLGKHLGVPKPFGPQMKGVCCLEEKVRSLLEPLELICTFINDYSCYHQYFGEVHCGTNVVRKPFSFKWWNCVL